MFQLPPLRVGDPIHQGRVTVFPLFAVAEAIAPDYILADEALATEKLTITEISESGSVPELSVHNELDQTVLFLEGEPLQGAKQHRILNTSVLVEAGKDMRLPVSCVEAGRWQYRSRLFQHGDYHSHPKLRHSLKRSVTAASCRGDGHGSDQRAIWSEVSDSHRSHGTSSRTGALSDCHEVHRERIERMQKRIGYVEGAHGLVVAVGDHLACLDLFDRPRTLEKAWDRLLSGAILEALEEIGREETRPDQEAVEALLATLGAATWQETGAAGAGREYHYPSEEALQASSLTLEDVPVHSCATMGV